MYIHNIHQWFAISEIGERERESERDRGRDRETVRNIDSTVLNLGKQGSAICTPGLSTRRLIF